MPACCRSNEGQPSAMQRELIYNPRSVCVFLAPIDDPLQLGQQEMRRLEARGEIAILRGPTADYRAGRNAWHYVRLRPPPPRWHRPARVTGLIAAALTAVGIALALLYAILSIIWPYLVGAATLLILALWLASRGSGPGHGGGYGYHWSKC